KPALTPRSIARENRDSRLGQCSECHPRGGTVSAFRCPSEQIGRKTLFAVLRLHLGCGETAATWPTASLSHVQRRFNGSGRCTSDRLLRSQAPGPVTPSRAPWFPATGLL